jgi:hypothetical protein
LIGIALAAASPLGAGWSALSAGIDCVLVLTGSSVLSLVLAVVAASASAVVVVTVGVVAAAVAAAAAAAAASAFSCIAAISFARSFK